MGAKSENDDACGCAQIISTTDFHTVSVDGRVWYAFCMENPEITINGKTYFYVRTRNHMPVSIYKGGDVFLRIGPKELIEKEVAYHRKLLGFGFPIAEIIGEGEYEGQSYFVEASLGEFHFGQVFTADFAKNGFVSDSIFRNLLNVAKMHAEAQLKTVSSSGFDRKEFENLIHFPVILDEAPHMAEKIKACMEKAEGHIAELPVVITHGDFNPHNIFEKGVIDWERATSAPAGYDLATNISHIFFFPRGGDYEYTGKYAFSKEQAGIYWKEIDALYESEGLPKISDYADDFIFCRGIWSAVRMQKFPKLQKWRYDLYEKLVEAYLKGENLTNFLISYNT